MAAELDFTLSLVDKLTKPLKQAQSAVTGFADKAAADFKRLGFGVAGLWGVAQGIKGMVNPARDMEAALAEVSSLDVSNKTLDQLRKTSQNFAVDYGESASAFVRSAYDIQSAIAGLRGDELPKFTEASAILAKATKSDTATITSYMGTMYGVFKNTAEKMGRTQWVEQIAGQTASAVQMFKTTGNEMSAAFTALGANAQAMKVSAAEQFAVLGQLQSTMSGSEAGTKYKSFLAGIGNAQKVLGLNFTNRDGSAKGITDIIDLIKGKFGDLSKVADADLLKKAFGSDEAVSMIKLLAGDVDGLKKNINSLGNIKGMDKAVEMAKKMVDPWDQVNSLLEQVRVSIGLRLDPVFAPFLQKIIDGGKAFMKWLDAFPNIARWIGYIAVSMISLAATGATVAVIMGTISLIKLGSEASGSIKLLKYTLDLLRPSLLSTRIGLMGLWIQEKAVWVWSKLVALWAGICKVAIAAWNVVLRTCTVAMRLFGIAARFAGMGLGFLLSPIGFVLLAIAALAAGIYFAIKYWDDIKAAIMDTQAFKWLQSAIAPVVGWFSDTWKSIEDGWNALTNWFKNFSLADSFGNITAGIGKLFDGIWDAIKKTFSGTWNWIVEKLNKIPGVNISTAQQDIAPTQPPALITGNRAAAIPGGPVSSQISNSKTEKVVSDHRSVNIQNLNVDTMPTPGQLAEYSELAAG
ncbi:phage tail tape measure protein [Salmonella enterica]|uniref:Phage tail tape measure protein n=1 Tax=Salmonella enterica TaxID=28901 RepID=A0A760VMR9_SALER|nr:phage tail protein [Salmonella enterica subsp. enterica serovar Chester]EBM0030900.1 phage tail protein [Salmonella enterica]EBU8700315.1 phage tail protein [Salmonella enterica subsp. enterica serovar Kokomlemle]EBY7078033.1 phage tail protein [Salmonella enterica subsp. enterica serovar Ealing]EDG3842282.1 phage tail protein [Salmonella enterica subsp. enterica serovar Rissen]EDQ9821134.1 phage tail tape measure protein [Salmonella enterica subsp. enterica]EDX3937834.1 phage tail tape me